MEQTNQRWLRIGIVLGIWTLAGLVYTSHLYLYHTILEGSSSFGEALAESFSDWYVWAFLSLFILKLAALFPLRRGGVAKALLVHIPACLFFSLVQVALHAAVDHLLLHPHGGWQHYSDTFSLFFTRTFHFGLLVYWVIITTRSAIEFYKDQALKASELQTQLAQAQLQALKMQLHPHFLFNTLHAISTLIQQDPIAADRMIAQLSELLRISLGSDQFQEIPLRQELEFLDKYLEIERTRFQDRLTVKMEIAPETLQAEVPNLILQPLVENSIHHGISQNRGPGTVQIVACKNNGLLSLRVRDNGSGLPDKGQFKEGVGLKNTRARLERLYGDGYRFEMKPASTEGGLEVCIDIPFHTAESTND